MRIGEKKRGERGNMEDIAAARPFPYAWSEQSESIVTFPTTLEKWRIFLLLKGGNNAVTTTCLNCAEKYIP